jgi:hypothetical protein
MSIDKFKEFQGGLKSSDRMRIDKLKRSIRRLGIIMPIFVWENSILDGHQRVNAITEMLKEGDTLEGNALPYLKIQAKSRKQAAEMVLAYSSEYAKITGRGLAEFIDEFELKVGDLEEFTELRASFEQMKTDDEKEFDENVETKHKCPKCGFQF